MQLYKILDIKTATGSFFVNTLFDDFLLTEGSVTTFSTFHVSGRINKNYFSADDTDTDFLSEEYAHWKYLKPTFFQIIKGKRLPVNFKLIFALPRDMIAKLFSDSTVLGAYLNVRYENSELFITTGVSYSHFTIDKNADTIWDTYVRSFLTNNNISFDIC